MTEEWIFTLKHFMTPGKAAQMSYEDRSPESWIRIGKSNRADRASKRRRPTAWKSTVETLEGRFLMAIAAPGQPVAYLVNGFGGCCIPMDVRNFIESHGGLVHVSNWNDILNDNGSTHTPGGNPGGFPYGGTPDPFTDDSFVADAVSAIEAQPASSPIILVGHSFGGDSILEVARALRADAPDRRIAVLATLDPVGRGGLRSNVTSPVPSNVDYFYNRWEQGPLPNAGGPPPPFDYLLSGHLSSNATQSDQREQSVQKNSQGKTKYEDYLHLIPRALSHSGLPNDAWVEKQLENVLFAKVFNPLPYVVSGAPIHGDSLNTYQGLAVTFSEAMNTTTFTPSDVSVSGGTTTVTVSQVMPVAGTGSRTFNILFSDQLNVANLSTSNPFVVKVGPDIRDLFDPPGAPSNNKMDQNRDGTPGNPVLDQFVFQIGHGYDISGPLVKNVIHVISKDLESGVETISGVVIEFDKLLDPATASALSNYAVSLAGTDGKFGTPDDVSVPISSAVYDPDRLTVTLTPLTPLATGQFVRVDVNPVQAPDGVKDLAGNLLDGGLYASPCCGFSVAMARGRNLAYTDGDGSQVNLALSGPGILDASLDLTTNTAKHVRVLGAVARQTGLGGFVSGGDGQASLPLISGMAGVSLGLPPEFQVGQSLGGVPDSVIDSAEVISSFTVTTTDDSGAGSLRQAILDANANPGADTILFDIGTGPITISPATPLPAITDPVEIDGTSQPGYAGIPLVELNGAAAGSGAVGLILSAGDSSVRGLAINRFSGDGILVQGNGGNVIAACALGTNPDGTIAEGNNGDGVKIDNAPENVIGGTIASDRNVISGNNAHGVEISGVLATGNRILGNVIGTSRDGEAALGNRFFGVFLQDAPLNAIGGPADGDGNIISANSVGVRISGAGASGNLVLGNSIGTDAAGMRSLGNSTGIFLDNAPDNTIGGPSVRQRNLISGNSADGIMLLDAQAVHTLVQGNLIGTDSSGTGNLANAGDGIHFRNTSNNTIGGTVAGAANIIAFNRGAGVAIQEGLGNLISANPIHDNGGLGIDLGEDGVTPNDPGDADAGSNLLQNFPVIASAVSVGGATIIRGTLDGVASRSFTLEWFASAIADPTGFGQGTLFLGATTAATDASGHASLLNVLPIAIPLGHFLTATARDQDSNTSEFCAQSR